MRPMLATPGASAGSGRVPTGPGWVHEIKWDGIRLLAQVDRTALRLTTRTERDVTVAFPELAGLVDVADDVLLDGELVTLVDGAPSFSHLVERVHTVSPRKAGALASARPATYLVFDLLRVDGLDLTALPWSRRRAALEELLPEGPHWHLSPTYADGPELLAATAEQGLEGIVSKDARAPYHPGVRSRAWLKFPHRSTATWVVGGWRPESGRSRLGAVLVGQPVAGGLSYRGRVGSGLAGRAGREMTDRLARASVDDCPFVDDVPRVDRLGTTWVRPEVIIEVVSLGVTAGARLRQPAYQRCRPDLMVKDV